MSGTKKLFEMSQRAAELNAEGNQFDEIVEVISDEWGVLHGTAHAVVESWWEGNIMKNFDWSEEADVGC